MYYSSDERRCIMFYVCVFFGSLFTVLIVGVLVGALLRKIDEMIWNNMFKVNHKLRNAQIENAIALDTARYVKKHFKSDDQ